MEDSIFARCKVAPEDSRRLRDKARALRLVLKEQRTLLRLARAKAAMDRAEVIAQRENLHSTKETSATRQRGTATWNHPAGRPFETLCQAFTLTFITTAESQSTTRGSIFPICARPESKP
ncbi:hypothetical protein ACFQX9_34455 [Bradyrhizobium sp. GCM10028915]|uniref:hypothetical protein n=1 Tax=Bradyrhizobium sp. GCM10028915 TaxID=3273385 RepID=UPI003610A4C5